MKECSWGSQIIQGMYELGIPMGKIAKVNKLSEKEVKDILESKT